MRLLVWQPVYVLGGGLHVLRSLVAAFLRTPGIEQVTVALNRRYPSDVLGAESPPGRLRTVRIDADSSVAPLAAGHDCIHVPWPHGAPFSRCGIPAVCVFQDTVLLDAIGGHATREFLAATERGCCETVAAYDRTILTSRYTRRRMVEIVGSERADCLDVIPHMADETPTAAPGLLPRAVRPPFVVYPANAAEHKNHETLLQAIAKRRRRDVPVVFYGYGTEQIGAAGSCDRPHINRINRLIRDRGLVSGRDFVSLGYVDDATAAAVFRSASGLVMPTRAEGMGLPIHEAIAAGMPVVCSDIEVLREHYEDRSAALLWVDPECPGEIAAALDRLCDEEPALRTRAADNRGCGRTWDAIAGETHRILEGLVIASRQGAAPFAPQHRRKPRGLRRLLRKLRNLFPGS